MSPTKLTILGGLLFLSAIMGGHFEWFDYPITLSTAIAGLGCLYGSILMHMIEVIQQRRRRAAPPKAAGNSNE